MAIESAVPAGMAICARENTLSPAIEDSEGTNLLWCGRRDAEEIVCSIVVGRKGIGHIQVIIYQHCKFGCNRALIDSCCCQLIACCSDGSCYWVFFCRVVEASCGGPLVHGYVSGDVGIEGDGHLRRYDQGIGDKAYRG